MQKIIQFILSFFRNATTDTIIAQFTKVIDKLEKHAAAHDLTLNAIENKIEALAKEAVNSVEESAKARKVAEKLKNFFN